MPSLLPPSLPVSQAGRAAHDLGLAGSAGGHALRAAGPPPGRDRDQRPARARRGRQRRLAALRGRQRARAGRALVGGWAGARAGEARDRELGARERRLARAKDALVATTAVAGVASAVEGVRFSRTAPGGAVPLRDGDHVAAGASPAAGALKPRLHALGAVTLAAEAGLVVVNAALAQEGFRRPPARRRRPWSRA